MTLPALREPDAISDYHAHVYFDPGTRDLAERFRAVVAARFTVELGKVNSGPIGPHTWPSYQIGFKPPVLGTLLPWLMLNRGALTVLVHPNTGDDVADHTAHAVWLGTPLPLDIDALRPDR
jgi:aromatic ring-cleaving dioxygenase